MKKIYWVGDMIGTTGPAIVNKNYRAFFEKTTTFCFTNNKIIRIIHFFIHLPLSKNIIISGFSKLNYLFAYISKFFGKKVIYLMHGYLKEEQKYQNNPNVNNLKIEYKLLKKVDKIICVSEYFSKYLKKELPQFSNKIEFVNNGIDKIYFRNKEKKEKGLFTIISVGGGNPRKKRFKYL